MSPLVLYELPWKNNLAKRVSEGEEKDYQLRQK